MVRINMAFTKYGINCYIPKKKNILLSGHPSKNAYLELPPGSFQIQEGWIFFFKLKVYICSLLKIGKKQKCP